MGRGSGDSVCRWSPHRAKPSQASDDSDFLTVTHPFHPLTGERLEILFERRMPAGLAYSCAGGPLGTVMLPATWTDRGEPPATQRLSYEVLVDLAATISALKTH
jgi:hypothetical protein